MEEGEEEVRNGLSRLLLQEEEGGSGGYWITRGVGWVGWDVDWMVGGGGFRRVWEGFGEIEIWEDGWGGEAQRARARRTPDFHMRRDGGWLLLGGKEGGVVADRLTG